MKVVPVTGDPRSLTLLEVNARYMTHEQFQRLTDNVRRDGVLSQSPFVIRKPDGRGVVLSGNHRVKAAIEAGLDEVIWLETTDDLTHEQEVAIQLSHNAISGQDDPAVLAQLYSSLDDLDWRAYSGLDDKTLELLADVDVSKLAEANLDYQMLNITFLPADMERAVHGFDEAAGLASAADEKWLARYEDHFRILAAIATSGKARDVRNQAASLSFVLDIFEAHRTDLQDGWYDTETEEPKHDGWIPLSTILGVDDIPAASAAVVNKALQKMISSGDLNSKSRWLALEAWAADYLAGA